MMTRDLAGRIADAAIGAPVGSYAWAAARFALLWGKDHELTEAEVETMLARIAEDVSRPQPTREPMKLPPGGFAATVDGRLVKVADSDESPEFNDVDTFPTVREIAEAQDAFLAHCEDETGIVVDAGLKAKKDAERATLRAQSHAIAAKLQEAGVTAYRSDQWKIAVLGVHSGEIDILPQFRRIAFIPFVAAAIREPMVRALEYWLQRHPHDRFWTFTSGPRCRLDQVRARLQDLHRRISALNAQPFMREAGVMIVFRASELGSIETKRELGALDGGEIDRDQDGTLWFHPHAHCLVHLTRGRLSRSAWSKLLRQVWAHWGDHWDDAGTIRTAREAVKYVTKPGQIAKLTAAETAALAAQLRRLKLIHPLGVLAAEMRHRKEQRLTLLRQQTDDGYVWREIRDPNRGPARADDPEAINIDTMQAAMRIDMRDHECCCVVAQCAPAAASNCVKEPRVIVMFNRYDQAKVDAHPLVQRLRERTRDAWLGGCALIRVHTGTPSVCQASPPRHFAFMHDLPERVAPPGVPVFKQ